MTALKDVRAHCCSTAHHYCARKVTRHVMHRARALSLINRFHVAVRLFSNRSQMTSKCGKNKKAAHKAIAECVTDVLILLAVMRSKEL